MFYVCTKQSNNFISSRIEAIYFDKLNIEIRQLKNIYSSLNSLNSSSKKFTHIIDEILGYKSKKASLWYQVISDENVFTADLNSILNKLESQTCSKFTSSLFEKLLNAIVRKSSVISMSLFHFNFILNLMENMGLDFLVNSTNFETKDETQLIGDYVYSIVNCKWDNVLLNRVILVDLMENFHDSDLQKHRLLTKLGIKFLN